VAIAAVAEVAQAEVTIGATIALPENEANAPSEAAKTAAKAAPAAAVVAVAGVAVAKAATAATTPIPQTTPLKTE
jgi:hypothetical protein